MKVYLLDNNNTLASALLRSQENCCLPSEVEKELKKHHRRSDLILFYERQNRHDEALQIITNTESASSNDAILDYLKKLGNDQLPLIFKYVQPMIKTALEDRKDEERLRDILTLFTGEQIPTSPSTIETPGPQTMKLDPIVVYEFLKKLNRDFAVRYLDQICFRPELGPKQREIHNQIVYACCDRLKELANELKRLIRNSQQEIHQGNECYSSPYDCI